MAKIDKRLNESKKKTTIKRKGSNFKIKDCVVNLKRLNDAVLHEAANSKKEFNLNIKICDEKFTIEKKSINLNALKTINIGLKVELNKILLESISQPVISKPKTLNQLIDVAWRECKSSNQKIELNIGQVVLGKMKGYSPWPAIIRNFTKNKKRVQLYFFGTDNNGVADINETIAFESSHDVVKLLLLRPISSFFKGVREAESVMGIEDNQSITNQPYSLEQ